MTARDKFNGIHADFWDASGAENLQHDDPISALEEWIEGHLEPDCDVEAVIREMGDIDVDAHVRAEVSDADICSAADRALESAMDYLAEDCEYADPNGDYEMFLPEARKKHLPAFEAAVRALVADGRIWLCEKTATVTLTPDETLEIIRAERPGWFEPKGGS